MNPTPLNFSVHAIEKFEENVKKVDPKNKIGLSERDRGNGLWLKNYFLLLRELLHLSVKFTLPDNGMLVQTNLGRPAVYEKERQLLKLPYTIIALEYEASTLDDRIVEGNQTSKKRIALAVDFEKVDAGIKGMMLTLMPALANVKTQNNVAIFSIFNIKDEGWSCSFGCAITSSESYSEDDEISKANKGCVPVYPAALLITTGVVKDFVSMSENVRLDTADEAITVVQFCAIMNCRNVNSVIIEAPKQLNRKRQALGRLPFYEYHVLTIDPSSDRSVKTDLGGTHASPRMHLRRGHIRRISRDKSVWVNAAIVGNSNNGIVEKSYQLNNDSVNKTFLKP